MLEPEVPRSDAGITGIIEQAVHDEAHAFYKHDEMKKAW